MGTRRITINGRHFDSLDAMPPDLRRLYEEALRAIGPSPAGGKVSDTSQIQTGPAGLGVDTNIVIHKKITVNNRTYGSLDEMPPEDRQLAERAFPTSQPKTGRAPTAPGQRLSMEIGRPRVRTFVHSSSPPPAPPLPFEPSSSALKAREFLSGLIFWTVVGLALWIFLGR